MPPVNHVSSRDRDFRPSRRRGFDDDNFETPPDGAWMVVEPMAGDRLEENLNPGGRL